MLNKDDILQLFELIDKKLSERNQKGEICIVGGVSMMLLMNCRSATKDIDAIFAPTSDFREIIEEISLEYGLPYDWLNDGVKGFLTDSFNTVELWRGTHLEVYSPDEEYLLAMKVLSSREGTYDGDDILVLINKLGLVSSSQVLDVVEKYYGKNQIESRIQYFIDDLMKNN